MRSWGKFVLICVYLSSQCASAPAQLLEDPKSLMGWKSNSNQAGDDEYPSLENRPEIALAIRKLDLEANRIGIEYRAAIIKMLSPDANLSDIDAAKQLAKLYQRATAEAASVRTSVTSDSATHELAALYRNAAKRAQSPEASPHYS